MTRQLFNYLFGGFMFFVLHGCTTHYWEPKDMNSRVGSVVEADLNPDFPFCGFLGRCKFDLHYFYGTGFTDEDLKRENSKPSRLELLLGPSKNILYIPGGPGDVVHREVPSLYALSARRENVVYFDVRGTGFSSLLESNAYDRFLRAKYVVKDIEVLRKQLLDGCSTGRPSPHAVWMGESPECKQDSPKPWDAIYAHSWGTIVAQRYAAEYPEMVKKLILSAPVSRGDTKTESARRERLIANLIDIYERHALTNCDWTRNSNSIFVQDFVDAVTYQKLDDFCFVRNKQKEAIGSALTTLLYSIEEEYGSTGFVQSFYSQLWNKDPNFQQRYQYPEEFFHALRQLEFLGAGDQYPMQFDHETKKIKIDAAFLLGFYAMLPGDIRADLAASNFRRQNRCTPDTPFLDGLPSTENGNQVRRNLCQRIEHAWNQLGTERSYNRSARARSVFGVFDGLARWVFGIMKRHQRLNDRNCFTGEDLRRVANGDLKTNVVMQEEAVKLGLAGYEEICPWDPQSYRHQVPTLILSGDADPVTAGGQAEDFYTCGLAPGERVHIEFPGVGHNMVLQADVSREEAQFEGAKGIATLVYLFLRRTPVEFRKDPDVLKKIKELNANLKPDLGAGRCTGF
jgi:pimeloyl-ACP methyl ester carboxylesterase